MCLSVCVCRGGSRGGGVEGVATPCFVGQGRQAVVTPACKLPVFLLHYVIAEKGVGHAIYGEEGRTVCRGIVQG